MQNNIDNAVNNDNNNEIDHPPPEEEPPEQFEERTKFTGRKLRVFFNYFLFIDYFDLFDRLVVGRGSLLAGGMAGGMGCWGRPCGVWWDGLNGTANRRFFSHIK